MNSPFTIPMEAKLEWLRQKCAAVLDAHGYATFNVVKFITKAMLGMESVYDFQNVFCDRSLSPPRVAWCRMAPIDQADATQYGNEDEYAITGGKVQISHTFAVLMEFEFTESDAYAGSTQEQFNMLLWGESPTGLLTELSTVGAEEVDESIVGEAGHIVEVDRPETIAVPEFPVAVFASQPEALVHHLDFRITLR